MKIEAGQQPFQLPSNQLNKDRETPDANSFNEIIKTDRQETNPIPGFAADLQIEAQALEQINQLPQTDSTNNPLDNQYNLLQDVLDEMQHERLQQEVKNQRGDTNLFTWLEKVADRLPSRIPRNLSQIICQGLKADDPVTQQKAKDLYVFYNAKTALAEVRNSTSSMPDDDELLTEVAIEGILEKANAIRSGEASNVKPHTQIREAVVEEHKATTQMHYIWVQNGHAPKIEEAVMEACHNNPYGMSKIHIDKMAKKLCLELDLPDADIPSMKRYISAVTAQNSKIPVTDDGGINRIVENVTLASRLEDIIGEETLLTTQEGKVIRMKIENPDINISEIADKFHLSKARISKIIQTVKKKLSHTEKE